MNSIELLKELIKIDSSTKEKGNYAIEYCSDYLKSHGIEGKIFENNGFKSYVAVLGEGDKTLVLNGHVDVVSGKENQFIPLEDEKVIVGRGSADMKGGCAAMIGAFIRLNWVKEKLSGKIMLQLVSDEEIGGKNCSGYLVENGYVGDFVICTEPTNLKISLKSKGIIRLDVESKGVSAHGSRPWEGKNAILKSIENYSVIEKLPIMNVSSKFYEKSTANLAFISGGDIYNRVPEKSVIGLDIRYVPNIDPNDIVENIVEAVDGNVIVKAVELGVNVDQNNFYVQEFSKTVLKNLGCDSIDYTAQHGGSDARFFAKLGIPAIEFGPSGDFWHGDDEYVEKESVKILEEILFEFSERFGSLLEGKAF